MAGEITLWLLRFFIAEHVHRGQQHQYYDFLPPKQSVDFRFLGFKRCFFFIIYFYGLKFVFKLFLFVKNCFIFFFFQFFFTYFFKKK